MDTLFDAPNNQPQLSGDLMTPTNSGPEKNGSFIIQPYGLRSSSFEEFSDGSVLMTSQSQSEYLSNAVMTATDAESLSTDPKFIDSVSSELNTFFALKDEDTEVRLDAINQHVFKNLIVSRALILNASNSLSQSLSQNQNIGILEVLEGNQDFKLALRHTLFTAGFDKDASAYLYQKLIDQKYTIDPKYAIRHTIDALLNINYIEYFKPGQATRLFQERHIVNFGRYDPRILLEQFEPLQPKDPLNLTLFSRSDHSGAFVQEQFDHFWKKIKSPQIAEFEDVEELVDQINQIHDHYQKPVTNLVLGAHGQHDSMQLGNDVSNQMQLIQSDQSLTELSKVREVFDPKRGTVVLISCNVGVEGGISEKIAKTLQVKTLFAQTDSGRLNRVRTSRRHGNVLAAHYTSGDAAKIEYQRRPSALSKRVIKRSEIAPSIRANYDRRKIARLQAHIIAQTEGA